MSKLDRLYSVRVDGHEITQITLSREQWGSQAGRDKVREMMADHYGIPTWGMRLQQIDCPYILWTDMKTGVTHKKEQTIHDEEK